MTKVLTLKILLVEPLLATGLEGDPNAATGLDYVPGAVIRGAAVGKYPGVRDAHDAAFRRLFLDGTTRFLNGYPTLSGASKRCLPCPLSLMKNKHRLVSDRTVVDHADPFAKFDSTIQWQTVQPTARYVRLTTGSGEMLPAKREIHVHTQRDRRRGRAISGSGAVFRYESLGSGQEFVAYVLCEVQDVQTLTDILQGDFCFGGSRTAGYGHTKISVAEEAVDVCQWREAGPLDIGNVPDVSSGAVRLTFASDAILRDALTGRHSATAETVTDVISRRLGITATPEQCRMFLRSITIGGFNRHWGLPLPQTIAVAMGSVVMFEDVAATKEKLQSLLVNGIGERTAEGFGRVVLNWSAGATFELSNHMASTSESAVQMEDSASTALENIQSRIQAQRIDDAIQKRSLEFQWNNLPSDCRSRLQNLKLKVQNELISGKEWNSGVLKSYIDDLAGRKTVCDKYARLKVGTRGTREPILAWIGKVSGSAKSESINVPNLQTMQSEERELIGAAAYQFRLRVIAMVLGRMIKDSKTQKKGAVNP